MHAHVCVCAHVCVHVCVCAWVCERGHVHYDMVVCVAYTLACACVYVCVCIRVFRFAVRVRASEGACVHSCGDMCMVM